MGKRKGYKLSTFLSYRMVESKSFTKALHGYYKLLLDGVASSIEELAKIQDDYKTEYESLKEIQKDPSLIFDRYKDLDEEEKDKLMGLLVRMAKLESKMMRLFELKSREKREVAKELKSFSEEYLSKE